MNFEEIPIAYEITELPKPSDINIAIVEGQDLDEAIVIGFRSKINKLREKYFTYIIFLSLFVLCVFAYVIIIMTIH